MDIHLDSRLAAPLTVRHGLHTEARAGVPTSLCLRAVPIGLIQMAGATPSPDPGMCGGMYTLDHMSCINGQNGGREQGVAKTICWEGRQL